MFKSLLTPCVLPAAMVLAVAAYAGAQDFVPAGIDPLSTTPLQCYNSGSGVSALRICVSDHGNVVKFETPAGFEQIGQANLFRDGYAICTGNLPAVPNVAHGYDTGAVESGFGPPTVVDTNPLTIARDTTDGIFRLTQSFKVDKKERDLTIEVTVTNISAGDQQFVKLQRAFEGDVDNNNQTSMWFGRTINSAFAWVDQPAAASAPLGHGLMLTALTTSQGPTTAVNTVADYNPGGTGSRTGNACIVFSTGQATPAPAAHNLVGRALYALGTIPAGGSKKVVYKYSAF